MVGDVFCVGGALVQCEDAGQRFFFGKPSTVTRTRTATMSSDSVSRRIALVSGQQLVSGALFLPFMLAEAVFEHRAGDAHVA